MDSRLRERLAGETGGIKDVFPVKEILYFIYFGKLVADFFRFTDVRIRNAAVSRNRSAEG